MAEVNQQTAIPVPVARADGLGPCAWCGEPATTEATIEPAVINNKKLVRLARKVPVCAKHAAMVKRNVRVAELTTERRRVASRQGNMRYKQDKVDALLREIDGQLAGLERVRGSGPA